MKTFCAFSLVIGFVASTTLAEDKAKKTYKLPKDPKATVISFDFKGGFTPRRLKAEPALSILADGTVQMPDRFGFSKDVSGKISQKELQALLRFAIEENKFFSFDAAKVKEKVKKASVGRPIARVADAPSSVIEIKLAGKSHKASYYALGLAANQFKTVAELQQLFAIQKRLNVLMNLTRLGGEKGLKAALKHANDELKKKYPKAKPLTADDLRSVNIRKDGKKTVSFGHYPRRPDGASDGTYVTATLQYPAKGEPMVFVRAKLK